MTEAGSFNVSPRPVVDDELAAKLARELYGAEGRIKELGSQQDRNFRVARPEGPVVLKVANKSWDRKSLAAQDAALLHIAQAHAKLAAKNNGRPSRLQLNYPAPVPVPSLDGKLMREAKIGEDVLLVRMLTFIPGKQLSGDRYLAPVVVQDLGRLAASSVITLADFDHPGLDAGPKQWDLQRAKQVVYSLAPHMSSEQDSSEVMKWTDRASARLSPVEADLRVQAIHGDITDDNIVAEPDESGRLRPHGIIDYGDLTRSWLIAELAVTCSCVLRHRPADPLDVLPAVRAFHAAVPLSDAEVSALWPLLVLRGATLVSSGEYQASLDPDNPSATEELEGEWRIFRNSCSMPFELAEMAFREALGLTPAPRYLPQRASLELGRPLLPFVKDIAVVDLSHTSDFLHSGSFHQGLEAEARLLRQAAGSGAAATRWAEARLTRTVADSSVAPATVALGIDLVLPPGTAVAAPWDMDVQASGPGGALALDGPAGRLALRGLVGMPYAGTAVKAGALLGTIGAAGMLYVRLCVEPSLEPPDFAPPAHRAAWKQLCLDPSKLLGLDVAAPVDDAPGLLKRRKAHLADVQEHYYEEPMHVERGWMHHIIDADSRSYLDMVNNVAAVGHSHPRLTAAITKQMRLLNTNSRFHYEAIAAVSERLAALAPAGLDSVFLVCSGSEAVDLALHMAQVITGRMDVLAVREAYHGWTMLSDAVTTSLYDNPRALETRPDWVHLAAAPNSFRGKFRGAAAAKGYIQEMKDTVQDMVSKGRPPAAFICEPLFGNAGGVVLPEGYLSSTYEAVRASGGFCIADEVQVGLGRLGHHWWAHEMQGVVPDFITIAKALGNGYPLGAVITTKAIADAFAVQGSFFASTGGSPVACKVALTVLDIIEAEGLQANAAKVGDFLMQKSKELMSHHSIIGAVHGMGLYMGVELVRDRESLEPATAECYAICDRLRELGVIVQPTGERANVLKMKPPMCLSMESAEFFIQQLDRVLSEGW